MTKMVLNIKYKDEDCDEYYKRSLGGKSTWLEEGTPTKGYIIFIAKAEAQGKTWQELKSLTQNITNNKWLFFYCFYRPSPL